MTDVVILVGGRGKRLGKLTLNTPKPLIKINNKRFLDILLKKISFLKINKIYLLCSYKKEQFFKKYHLKKLIIAKLYVLTKVDKKIQEELFIKLKIE